MMGNHQGVTGDSGLFLTSRSESEMSRERTGLGCTECGTHVRVTAEPPRI